jgi:DNA gyrase subunit A
MAMTTKDDDWIEHLFVASAHDYVLFFTSVGKVYRVKAWELPEAGRQSRGRALVNVLPLAEGERVMAVFRTRDYTEGQYLVMGTRQGIVKKTPFRAYDTNLRADGIIALRIRDGDELVDVRLTDGADRIMMVSRGGRAISFDETDVRPMGRAASGVRGMRLRGGDTVAALRVPKNGDDLLVVTEHGYGKRTPVDEYPTKGRGTLGVLAVRITEERGPVTGALVVSEGQDVMIITERGIVTRQSVSDVRRTGRTTQGVLVQRLRDDDRVAAVALVRSSDDPDAEGGAGEADLELPADLVDEALEAAPGEVVELEPVEDIEEVDVEADAFDADADVDELVDDEGDVVDELDEAIEDGDEG